MAAQLRLDRAGGTLLSDTGDRLAHVGDGVPDPVALGRALDKARLAAFLMQSGRLWSLDIHFAAGDRLYRLGESITVQVQGRTSPHLTLFNLGSDGRIAYLYPLPGDPPTVPTGAFRLDLVVAPPVGADHVIAIETDVVPAALRDVLRRHDGSTNLRAFWEAFRTAAASTPGSVRLAAFPFHTAE